jgi:hypothetical protein
VTVSITGQPLFGLDGWVCAIAGIIDILLLREFDFQA